MLCLTISGCNIFNMTLAIIILEVCVSEKPRTDKEIAEVQNTSSDQNPINIIYSPLVNIIW